MKQVKVNIILEEGVKFKPSYQTEHSAGADVFPLMADGEKFVLKPGERKLFKTGIKMEIPVGYEVQVRPRSGLAFKKGITVINAPGTVDSDFTGDIGVILINHGQEDYVITNEIAIAQLVLSEVPQMVFKEIKGEEIKQTARGEGGFGHTGNM